MRRKAFKSEDLYVKTYKVMCCSHFVRIKLTARMTEKWEVCMSVSTEARHIRNSSALPLFTRDHFKTRSQALIAHCGMSEIYHQTPPLRRGLVRNFIPRVPKHMSSKFYGCQAPVAPVLTRPLDFCGYYSWEVHIQERTLLTRVR